MSKKRPTDQLTTCSSPAKVSKADLMCQVILEKLPAQITSAVDVRPVSLVWCGAQPVDVGVDMEMEVDEVKMEDLDEVEEDDIKTEVFDEDDTDTAAAAVSDTGSNDSARRQSTVTASTKSKQLVAATRTVKQSAVRTTANNKLQSTVQSVVTKTPSTNSQGVTIKSILEAKRHSADNVRSLLSAKLQPASSQSAPLAPVITVINLSSPATSAPRPATGTQRPQGTSIARNPGVPVAMSHLTGVPVAVRSVLRQTVGTSISQQPQRSQFSRSQLIIDAKSIKSVGSKLTTTSTTTASSSKVTAVTACSTSSTMSTVASCCRVTSPLTSNIDVSAIVLQSALPNGAPASATTATDSKSLADIAARMISRQPQLVNSIANENAAGGINTVVLNRSTDVSAAGATDHSYYVCEDAIELKRLLLESNARKHELVRKLKDQEKKSAFWCNKANELQSLVTQLKRQLADKTSTVS